MMLVPLSAPLLLLATQATATYIDYINPSLINSEKLTTSDQAAAESQIYTKATHFSGLVLWGSSGCTCASGNSAWTQEAPLANPNTTDPVSFAVRRQANDTSSANWNSTDSSNSTWSNSSSDGSDGGGSFNSSSGRGHMYTQRPSDKTRYGSGDDEGGKWNLTDPLTNITAPKLLNRDSGSCTSSGDAIEVLRATAYSAWYNALAFALSGQTSYAAASIAAISNLFINSGSAITPQCILSIAPINGSTEQVQAAMEELMGSVVMVADAVGILEANSASGWTTDMAGTVKASARQFLALVKLSGGAQKTIYANAWYTAGLASLNLLAKNPSDAIAAVNGLYNFPDGPIATPSDPNAWVHQLQGQLVCAKIADSLGQGFWNTPASSFGTLSQTLDVLLEDFTAKNSTTDLLDVFSGISQAYGGRREDLLRAADPGDYQQQDYWLLNNPVLLKLAPGLSTSTPKRRLPADIKATRDMFKRKGGGGGGGHASAEGEHSSSSSKSSSGTGGHVSSSAKTSGTGRRLAVPGPVRLLANIVTFTLGCTRASALAFKEMSARGVDSFSSGAPSTSDSSSSRSSESIFGYPYGIGEGGSLSSAGSRQIAIPSLSVARLLVLVGGIQKSLAKVVLVGMEQRMVRITRANAARQEESGGKAGARGRQSFSSGGVDDKDGSSRSSWSKAPESSSVSTGWTETIKARRKVDVPNATKALANLLGRTRPRPVNVEA